MQTQSTETNQIVHAIWDRQGKTDAKLESISMDRGEITEIKDQERQDKILESLALRSLEQETELRDLKRIK